MDFRHHANESPRQPFSFWPFNFFVLAKPTATLNLISSDTHFEYGIRIGHRHFISIVWRIRYYILDFRVFLFSF
tara:strand:- start:80 stop:301 length:222 start_codon:yes stop_codon:yes gene_type:complete